MAAATAACPACPLSTSLPAVGLSFKLTHALSVRSTCSVPSPPPCAQGNASLCHIFALGRLEECCAEPWNPVARSQAPKPAMSMHTTSNNNLRPSILKAMDTWLQAACHSDTQHMPVAGPKTLKASHNEYMRAVPGPVCPSALLNPAMWDCSNVESGCCAAGPPIDLGRGAIRANEVLENHERTQRPLRRAQDGASVSCQPDFTLSRLLSCSMLSSSPFIEVPGCYVL